jgi:nucleotide-binding universal stress UspA family protein
MKKILVPTDFSQGAEMAVKYAAELANKINAELVLFHATHVPVMMPGAPMPVYDYPIEQFIENNLIELKKSWEKISGSLNYKILKIQYVVKTGFAGDEIKSYAQENEIDFIVMGTSGASGLRKIIGSIASDVALNAKCPVIAVPYDYPKGSEIKKIVLAADYKKADARPEFAAEFAKMFGAEILIYHVQKDNDLVPSAEEAEVGLTLEATVKSIPHSYHFSVDGNVAESINTFSRENKADLLVLMPHKKNFFERIFKAAVTGEITESASIPVMIIP